MILLAIIIYVFFNLVPRWVMNEKFKLLEKNFNWKVPFLKLSGLLFSLLFAFVLTYTITKSTKDKFIENKNVIYGYEFNSSMEKYGLQDGMKIKSINGKEIDRVSDILSTIIFENDYIEMSVEKNGIVDLVVISELDILELMQNQKEDLIVPIMFDSNGENEIKVTTRSYGFSDALSRLKSLLDQAYYIIDPNPSYKDVGKYKAIPNDSDFRSQLTVLSLNLIFLGILNLIPLPGFSIGNFLISVIETIKKKLFNNKRKRIIGFISITLIVIILVIKIYF
ncbi:M50 family metallopeptidase [Psychroserpens ponticola]|uniref:M50 family metallopeptidase n=1 Tax=Psychroserpens ponticola TaxID=2932268 RepID=A0ABY7RU62_9FLAO|nr:M50 family metallopeptidase [Psychroserpens ponticola]WCO00276.1 M50 family metallopeptidase [Psychroserpens ponticola]